MTVLENSIRINAPPEKVWSVLASLGTLDQYDPGIKKSEVVSVPREGLGSARRCDLTPGGWFKEKVVAFQPHESLTFELFECTLPVRRHQGFLRRAQALRRDWTTPVGNGVAGHGVRRDAR